MAASLGVVRSLESLGHGVDGKPVPYQGDQEATLKLPLHLLWKREAVDTLRGEEEGVMAILFPPHLLAFDFWVLSTLRLPLPAV